MLSALVAFVGLHNNDRLTYTGAVGSQIEGKLKRIVSRYGPSAPKSGVVRNIQWRRAADKVSLYVQGVISNVVNDQRNGNLFATDKSQVRRVKEFEDPRPYIRA